MPAVETHRLCKTYESVKKQPGVWGAIKGLFTREKVRLEAVRNVDLRIESGEMVGFLGPNGAGKTTTLKMLTGILHPTSGEARVLGFRPFDRRPEMLRRISLVMGNKMQLWWDLPAYDSFAVLAELYEVPREVFRRRLSRLADCLQIADKMHTQVRKLSLGERMKCELIAALLHSPEVVFLDEPTLGLDVVSQKRIREFLREWHRESGCTVLLTSHYMQDVRELCERVVVIDHGSVVFEGTLEELTLRFSDTKRLRLRFSQPVEASDLGRFGRVLQSDAGSAVLEVCREETPAVAAAVLASLPGDDVSIEDVDIEEVVRTLFTSGRG
ncbi:MAG: ATP-binding cassette domain-containing protein [Fimbriimonadales bacterium]|nr:ATP-binding cassette domain-containing protein [Fimbriimonadales bacterium]